MRSQIVKHDISQDLILPHQAQYQQTMKNAESNTRFGRYVVLGLLVMSVMIGGSAYWAVNARLDGAVVAPASFVVDGNRKTVQHLEGGIVNELLVREGDVVEANQTLIRLDSSDNDVDLGVLGGQIAELEINRGRLLAQLRGQNEFSMEDVALIATSVEEEKIRSTFETQKQLFDTQLRSRLSEREVLDQRIASLEEEIEGLEDQRTATKEQMGIARKELGALEKLFKQGFSAASTVNAVRREIERLRGQDAAFRTSQARAVNQIAELKLTGLSEEKRLREAITTELASVEARIASVKPQYLGAIRRQTRIDVKAPVSGKIVNLQIYTKGGVIRPGQPILDIVPADEELVIEARVNTTDVEKLRIGQQTNVRLTAFDQSDVPEASGQIIDLSADSLRDERTGSEYYVAKVRLDDEQNSTVQGLSFVPGMPADVFIKTGERTAISYLVQPFTERLARTFTE